MSDDGPRWQALTDSGIRRALDELVREVSEATPPEPPERILVHPSTLRAMLRGMAARPLTLRAQDPLAIVIAAVVGLSAELGFFEWAGLGASAVAEILAGLLALAGIVRHVMEKRRDADVLRIIETAKGLTPAADAIARSVRRGGAAEGGELEIGETPIEGLPIKPEPEGKRENRKGLARLGVLPALILGSLLALLLTGCAGLGSYAAPTVGDLVGRIDVGKVIQCARMPTPRDKARCLGVEVLTKGIDFALGEAAKLGEAAIDAANPHAGADDMTDRDRRKLARDLDRSLNVLAHELAAVE